MLLILSDRFDSHADYVSEKLSHENIAYFRFNLDVDSLKNTYITFSQGKWSVLVHGETFDSSQITCVWCRRPFMELTLEEQNYDDVDFKIWRNEWNKTLLGLYNSLKTIPWLNPLRKAYKGENKYYQMDVAQEVGFIMPDTLVTNKKKMVADFLRSHEKCLFKLMSQEMYDSGDEGYKGLYTNVISMEDLSGFSEHEENPIVLQEYIDKKFEVRYTVVGNDHFVCRIDSQKSERAKSDWRRYDIAHTPHQAIDAPENIFQKVSKMLSVLGLEYGALDFIVTPEDKWYFLEINCMGQWLWIEQLTGLPISDSIVKWIKAHINSK